VRLAALSAGGWEKHKARHKKALPDLPVKKQDDQEGQEKEICFQTEA
jgi:hypothetical protein